MMPGKKVITDSMDSKEIIALLHEDFAFCQHKYDETYKHYEKLAKGYSHRKDRVDFKPLSFRSAVGFNHVFRYYGYIERKAQGRYKKLIAQIV